MSRIVWGIAALIAAVGLAACSKGATNGLIVDRSQLLGTSTATHPPR